KAKSTLLLAILDEHLLKFHGIKDTKTLWETIKTRFGGNRESKKMQKTILKQQYENFASSRSEDKSSSTNKAVNTTHNVSIASSQGQASALTYADDVAMLAVGVKRFIKKTGRNLNFNGKETVSFDKTKVECYNYHRKGYFTRECRAPRSQGNRNADNTRRVVPMETPANTLVVTDGIGYDWSYQAEEGPIEFALMAFSSSGSSSSDTKLKKQLEESLKEKDDLKLKLEKHETSSKNLTNLIISQICPKDKTGLGYDSQLNERDLNNKSNVFESASNSSVNESEEDKNQENDRYKAGEGYHAVLPPYTGNFMTPKPDLSFAGLDDSIFKSAISETVISVHETKTSA
nr:ribonuclease H-like domain-containing protein [Tanacetum cinerariifolium]